MATTFTSTRTASIRTREEFGAVLQHDQNDPRVVILMQAVRDRKAAKGITAGAALDQILRERRNIADKVSRPYAPKDRLFPRVVFFDGHIGREMTAICAGMAMLGTLVIAGVFYAFCPPFGYMEILRTFLHLT